MRSTGEVMGIDADPGRALAKALVASGASLPSQGTMLPLGREPGQAVDPVPGQAPGRPRGSVCSRPSGTAAVLERAGIAVSRVAQVSEGDARSST